jgi:hypothetical protein
MNVYTYIAEKNPYGAKAVCHSLGYKISGVKNSTDLGYCLSQIVDKEGETGLRKVMEQHPDKDVICELFTDKSLPYINDIQSQFSGFNSNNENRYMNFDGNREYNNNILSSSANNTVLIASALIIAVAIISKNK